MCSDEKSKIEPPRNPEDQNAVDPQRVMMKPELAMARLDYPDCSPLPPSGAESASAAPSQTTDAPSSLHDRATGRVPDQVADRVPQTAATPLASATSQALKNLRGFAIAAVVSFHSVLAYLA